MKTKLIIHPIFDTDSHTITYVVSDPVTKKCAIIDSVLDYNHKNVETDTVLADKVIAYITEHGLTNEWILETHMHADHISASHYLQEKVGGKKAIGNQITVVQTYLKKVFDLNDHFRTDGSQFDHLFLDGEEFMIGGVKAKAIHVPGHTPADMAYLIDGVLFTGDTLLTPDIGTARCDFPGGSAEAMYDSVRYLLETLPKETQMYICHDYPEGKNRELVYTTTVGEQRKNNIHVRDGITKQEFVKLRSERDKTLDLPSYIFPAVQINGNAGSIVPGEFIKLSYNNRVL
ncbi:MAG: MBL fold metallo-hydrolase [Candidatus Pacebacteria bacterium]|nr:MBL fold metallo-hydrolase [Candidatus Paceibacterota bacterium]